VHTGRPVIDITFEVPYKNASRDLVIKSNISFARFLTRAAERMDTSPLLLSQIGYTLLWNTPKSGRPIAKLLEDEESFQKLIEHVWAYIDQQKARYRGKGKVKPFSIQIVDTSEADNTASKVYFFDFLASVHTKRIIQGGGKKSIPSPNPPMAQKKEKQLISLLEKKHACEEHSRACYVQANGMHYQYTKQDLTIWATLLVCLDLLPVLYFLSNTSPSRHIALQPLIRRLISSNSSLLTNALTRQK